MMSVHYNEFDVGDIVTIVDGPYDDCPFTWVDTMDQYISREAEITDRWFDDGFDTYGYYIDIDHGRHTWCGNCFLPKELPDFEPAEDSDIVSFLGL